MLKTRKNILRENKIKKTDLLNSIKRSGYLLESEIALMLAKEGYFIETNQIIKDPITDKSRELDILAEYYEFFPEFKDYNVATKIRFIFEIKNNSYPLVLLTKFELSPNIEIFLGFKEIVTRPKYIKEHKYDSFFERLIGYEFDIFTQYCSFDKKKANDELMALHPENVHNGLLKITQYCEESMEEWELMSDDIRNNYFRNFVYLPVLLIKDNLYELEKNKSGRFILKSVSNSKLIFNYHYKNESRFAIVYVITKAGLNEFLKTMRKVENDVFNDMINIVDINRKKV